MASVNDELRDIVAEESTLIDQFVELLKTEQAALTQGNTDELARIAAEKEPLSAELQRLGRLRIDNLTALKLTPDRRGMATWAAGNPGASSVWETTLTKAAQARDLNRLNGELIQMRLQYNSRILEILQRNTLALDLYGPDGKTSGQDGRRIDDAV